MILSQLVIFIAKDVFRTGMMIKFKKMNWKMDYKDLVAEYQRQGVKIEGLLEPAEKPKQIIGKIRKFGDIFEEKKDEFYQRMGWK